ncbi:MAG: amidohydrolase family protein [Bacteroidales bacterium]|jgi:dihydroorotase|nr:amidohydrolase family protein [Bacteroidales bacterium]MCI2146011.1 amidohydrolase family protein [Bacteroidales bacterium]
MTTLIENGHIVNEGKIFTGSILIREGTIDCIVESSAKDYFRTVEKLEEWADNVVDAEGMYVAPGVIDEHVHFREPGATWKGCVESESRAAALGGVTSFMDMPNNDPPAVTREAVDSKFSIAAKDSWVNYSFYIGATNGNIEEIARADPHRIPGVKVFMSSSTGNMRVDDPAALDAIFSRSPLTITAHCEKQEIIDANLEKARKEYTELIPYSVHELVRSREECIRSTAQVLDLALKHGSSLHVLHLSTAEEVGMIAEAAKANPKISGEICVQYLVLDDTMYGRYGPMMKCNPSIKKPCDKLALREALKKGIIRVVATDHAPHLFCEKDRGCFDAPSGVPLIQNSLQIMLELCKEGVFRIEDVVSWMCHGPAERFRIEGRGFIRKGYKADIVIFDTERPCRVIPMSRAGWSLFSSFSSSIVHTFVNGVQVVEDGKLTMERNSQALSFRR